MTALDLHMIPNQHSVIGKNGEIIPRPWEEMMSLSVLILHMLTVSSPLSSQVIKEIPGPGQNL